MKHVAIGLSLLLASTMAGAQTVDVGIGNWSNVPAISPRGNLHVGEWAIEQIERNRIAQSCNVPGLSPRRIDLRIPFVIQFRQDGGVERVVLRDMHCPQLETIMGGAVVRLAQAGEYRPTGVNPAGWYRSEISLFSQ